MYKTVVHLTLSATLFIGAAIMFHYARTDPVIRQIDGVQLTTWNKQPINLETALEAARGHPVLQNDPGGCRNMIERWWFPRVVYSDPTITPGCAVNFHVGFQPSRDGTTSLPGPVRATVVEPLPTGCTVGEYPIELKDGTNTNTAALITGIVLNVTADAAGAIALTISHNGTFGGDWAANGTNWQTCVAQRTTLAKWVNGNMSCATEASQMCSCVYTFTNLFSDFSSNILGYPNISANEVLRQGLDTCTKWRRKHDNRYTNDAPACIAHTLFVFALVLLLNNFYNAMTKWFPMILTSWEWHMGTQAVYWVIVFLLVFIPLVTDTKSAVNPSLLTIFPALAIGIYFEFTIATQQTYHRPYLLPYTFDICLCSLATFTMLARGVTQFEHISVEIIKCHVVAMLYSAVVWYYIYLHYEGARVQEDRREASVEKAKDDKADPTTPRPLTARMKASQDDIRKNAARILNTPSVQDAFLMIVGVAAALTMDSLIIPYPSRQCFALHYLLPPAFTLIAFLGLAWLSVLNLTHIVQTAVGDKVLAYYQDITGYMVFLVGAIMFGLFLKQHMLLYSSRQSDTFPYLDELVGTIPTLPAFIHTPMLP